MVLVKVPRRRKEDRVGFRDYARRVATVGVVSSTILAVSSSLIFTARIQPESVMDSAFVSGTVGPSAPWTAAEITAATYVMNREIGELEEKLGITIDGRPTISSDTLENPLADEYRAVYIDDVPEIKFSRIRITPGFETPRDIQTMHHEIGHQYTRERADHFGLKYIFAETPPSDMYISRKIIVEGIGEYFSGVILPSERLTPIDLTQPYLVHLSEHQNLANYHVGREFVGPFLDDNLPAGIDFLINNLPKFEDLNNLKAAQDRLFTEYAR